MSGRKFRGKYKGETRGPYEKVLLYAETKNEKETIALDDKINKYFSGLGYQVDESTYFTNNDYDILRCFHVAGATIALSTKKKYRPVEFDDLTPEEIDIEEQKRISKKPYIQLFAVSNQGISDIIAKLKNEYPIFKERPLKKRRYV